MANLSLIIPVYNNSASLPKLLAALEGVNVKLGQTALEVVFVVDGSPDDSFLRLQSTLPNSNFASQLILLSRNFGSFSAIRAGLEAASGSHFAVVAADLQEPPELILDFHKTLSTEACDVVLGVRSSREDPILTKFAAKVFWSIYRSVIMPEMPPGGIDVFACNRMVRDSLVRLQENHTSLVGLLLWVGFRRKFIKYSRRPRADGESAWTFNKKLQYMMDSIFSFSDLPIKILTLVGLLGILFSSFFAAIVLTAKLYQKIPVPGYAATVTAISFFGGLNCFGLGILGGYCWRTYENTKSRPNAIVAFQKAFNSYSHEGD